MPNIFDLRATEPKDNYQRIVQFSQGRFYDGRGNEISPFFGILPSLVLNETLQGDIDGVNRNFFTDSQFVVNTTTVYVNGIKQKRGIDYIELNDNQIQFSYPVWVQADLTIDYERYFIPSLVFGEELNGEINGINKVFSTNNMYLYNTSTVYVNGVKQKKGATYDYIELGDNQIEFTYPIWVGADLTIDYEKQ